MSEEGESFLARWAKRKAQARAGEAIAEAPPPEAAPAPAKSDAAAVAASREDTAEIALEDLPPLESIDSSTDLTPWLTKNVPEIWKQAALRRVWAADPAIRDFTGLADYDWDWNAPDGVPGFGPLRVTDDVSRLLAQAIGEAPEKPAEQDPAQPFSITVMDDVTAAQGDAPEPEQSGSAGATLLDESRVPQNEAAALSSETELHTEPIPVRRRRGGGALPS